MAIKIYIDQGHNPVNPNAGAEGNGLREQNIVYTIGQELAGLLRQSGNYEVRLSRPTADTQVGTSNSSSLRLRTEDANAWGADYFISLHTNASELAAATGSEAFVFALGGTAAALATDIFIHAQVVNIKAHHVAQHRILGMALHLAEAVAQYLFFLHSHENGAVLAAQHG